MLSPVFDQTPFGEYLLALGRAFGPEVTLSDGQRVLTPEQWIGNLGPGESAARIVSDSSGSGGKIITVALPRGRAEFRLEWSPDREGWVVPQVSGASVMHFFAPKSRHKGQIPHCGNGMLISLCKRNFAGIETPMIYSPKPNDPRICKTCLKRIQEAWKAG